MIQFLKDMVLEFRIGRELGKLLASDDRNTMRFHAKRMADMVKRRSPQQVARMEAKAGLR